MEKIRVMIVDDSSFVLKALGKVLGSDPEIEVVGFAEKGSRNLQTIIAGVIDAI